MMVQPLGTYKATVYLPAELADRIATLAQAERRSFSSMLTILAETGLDNQKETT